MSTMQRTISLQIEAGEGPLHGRASEAEGSEHEFQGWLGLLTVLGALLDAPPRLAAIRASADLEPTPTPGGPPPADDLPLGGGLS